ncbi:hypothetical protein QBC37DRAFT_292741 [Rhypophila decipiens]|uniref:RBR-type E3 ubiquitin transferase n=1 Tax=Rhypophila decipiens TaxID=261697 RepID=A0AAN6Y0S3_9PEZI|nr:hypothetical protein QBC37DRAFT_292741 [Rhypophila decipiens]
MEADGPGDVASGDPRLSIPCRFFAQNRCRYGASCYFSHAEQAQSQRAADSRPSPENHGASTSHILPMDDVTALVASRSRIRCRFHLQGYCFRGQECHFAHDQAEEGTATMPNPEESSRPETCRREMHGFLVTVGDGAVVTKVSFPSDFSAVRISRLRETATARSVVNLLALHGFEVSEDCVLTFPEDGKHRTAEVQVDDAQFAERLCALPAMRSLGAAPINVRMPQTDYGQIESKEVDCFWQKPPPTARLVFDNRYIADSVALSFEYGDYTVLHHRVSSDEPKRTTDGLWAINLSGITALASIADIMSDVPPSLAPQRLELEAAPTLSSLDVATRDKWLQTFLLRAGPGPFHWQQSFEMPDGRFRARARFLNVAGARPGWAVALSEHAQSRWPFPDDPLQRVSFHLVHSTRFKVPTRIYDIVEQEITERHKTAWAAQNLVYIAYDPSQGYRVLTIEGQDKTDVASAKATLDKIFGRYVVLDGEAHDQNIQVSNKRDSETSSTPNPPCTICWTEAENPVTLAQCKHVYCAECFENLCLAGAKNRAGIRCQGVPDGRICNEIITLTELQEHISPPALEDIFEVALAFYVASQSSAPPDGQLVKYCPTPDCQQLYRACAPAAPQTSESNQPARSALFTCPTCQAVICTGCHTFSHEGLTCEQEQEMMLSTSGYQELQKVKRELGIKHCPKCGIMIEKIDGCSHVICEGCGVDFCWSCLKLYSGKLNENGVPADEALHDDCEEEED